MSGTSPSLGPFYVAGGTLRPGTPSYITRKADEELYDRLLAGDFCYVLTARQMGKSSLMASTAKRLEEDGVRAAIVDLTQIGTARSAADATQWYFGVAYEIHKKLGLAEPLRPWWQERAALPALQCLTEFFREFVLTHCPGKVVVFVDEIDSTIGLPFADDFFAAIRACYNSRATDSAFERLTFVLLGVASPDQLIQDRTRTPFNVGHRIDLSDFTLAEARLLAAGLHTDAEVAAQRLERILYWTSGHPYLTQALCRATEERSIEPASPEAIVDPLVQTLFLSSRAQREETNLKYARARLTREGAGGRRLLRLYLRVRKGQKISDEPTSPLFAQLKLSGVVKVGEDGNLAVRDRIYAAVFTPQWAKSEMPADRGLQLAAAMLAAAAIGLVLYYEVFYPKIYVRQFQAATESDAYAVAAQAHAKLGAIPFWKSRADELLAEFWDYRALQQAGLGHRDASLLSRLKAIEVKDTPLRRKEAQALVGEDYAELLRTFRFSSVADALAFSTDGSHALAATKDGSVLTWDLGEHWSLRQVMPARPWSNSDKFLAVRFSENGEFLLALDQQGRIKKFCLTTGRLIDTMSTGEPEPVSGLTIRRRFNFSLDGRYLSHSFGRRDDISIWDRDAKRYVISQISAVAFNQEMIAVVMDDVLRVGNLGASQFLRSPLQRLENIKALEFSQDRRLLLLNDYDGAVRLWNWKTGAPLGTLLHHGELVASMAVSADKRMILTGGGEDRIVRLWQNRGERQQRSLPKVNSTSGISLRANQPGFLIGKGREIGFLTPSGEMVPPLWHIPSDSGIVLDPAGRFVLEVTNTDLMLRVAETGSLACHLPIGDFVEFSWDGRAVAIFSGLKDVRLWNTRNCQPIPVSIDVLNIYGTRFMLSEDEQLLAAVDTMNGVVTFSDARTGRPTGPALKLPSAAAMEFTPDKSSVLVGAYDGEIQFWSTSAGRPLSPALGSGRDPVRAVKIRPNGRSFVVATSRWLYSYALEDKIPLLRSARLLRGSWGPDLVNPRVPARIQGIRFVSGCGDCLEVVEGYSDGLFVEKIHFDEPDNPPIQGNPRELLAHWQKALGIKFDEKMNFSYR